MNRVMYRHSTNNGQVLIEAMVGISIATVGLLGMFSLLSHSLSLNRVVSQQYVGANLASEGIELVKNLIDRNVMQSKPWNEGLSPGDYEIDYNDTALTSYAGRHVLVDGTGRYSYDGGADTLYTRHVIVSWPSADEIKVESKVTWISKGGANFEASLEDHFFNWR